MKTRDDVWPYVSVAIESSRSVIPLVLRSSLLRCKRGIVPSRREVGVRFGDSRVSM